MYMKNFFGRFVCIVAVVAILEALECNQEICSNACGVWNLNGTCKGNECYCSYGKKCSAMIETICEVACDQLDLSGECNDDGYCVCKAELEPCEIFECEEQCLADPRAIECEALGGVVTPTACIEYGPIRTCLCLCTLPGKNVQSSSALFEYSVNKHQNNV